MAETQDSPSSVLPERFNVEAVLVGERIDLHTLAPRLASAPMVMTLGNAGYVVLFRYGAVVFFNVDRSAQTAYLDGLEERIVHRFEKPQREEVTVIVGPQSMDQAADGVVVFTQAGLTRVQVLAEVLANSVVLAHYETQVTEVLARVEPLALSLRGSGRVRRSATELLKDIGQMLAFQHQMVGRAEVLDKPEVLWDNPELERLYVRLEDEYELRERQVVVERKLQLISNTAETILDVLHTNRSLRVEWYIVILILVEIALSVYSIFVAKVIY